jgi:hypothetical protein
MMLREDEVEEAMSHTADVLVACSRDEIAEHLHVV